MKKYMTTMFAVLALFLFSHGLQAGAEDLRNPQPYHFLKNAFQTQVSLSEQPRSSEEIKRMMNTQFTAAFTEKFMKENVVKIDGGYAALGSDFALYYIPFFSYNQHTKIKYDSSRQTIFVQEHFSGSDDGPVTTESHFETVILVHEGGSWKIADVLYGREKK
jgi:hypothetical protein